MSAESKKPVPVSPEARSRVLRAAVKNSKVRIAATAPQYTGKRIGIRRGTDSG